MLRQTLACLARQTLAADQIEICVVDDGPSQAVATLAAESFPFGGVRYLPRNRQGATAARNAGALESCGEILIFLDDDIRPVTRTLETLVSACQAAERTIAMGTLVTPPANKASVFARLSSGLPDAAHASTVDHDVPVTDCLTGLLAIRRADFFQLGMFQDPTGGWPNWDDVDFGYRAGQAGFRLRRIAAARAEHWDSSVADLSATCHRWQRASQSAVQLLRRYPALAPALPMFADKMPIEWRRDSPWLVARKLVRRLGASAMVVASLEWVTRWLEQHWPVEPALRPLYRWIIGAYIFRGFQRGLEELQCSTP